MRILPFSVPHALLAAAAGLVPVFAAGAPADSSAPGEAADLPAWALSVAGSATLPPGEPRSARRVLMHETLVVVDERGGLKVTQRAGVQFLREGTRGGVTLNGLRFSTEAEALAATAWRVPLPTGAGAPDASPRKVPAERLAWALPDTWRHGLVTLGAPENVRRGEMLFVEIEATDRRPSAGFIRLFGGSVTYVRDRLTLRTPEGWIVTPEWLRGPRVEARDEVGVKVWELEAQPAHPWPPLADPLPRRLPALAIGLGAPGSVDGSAGEWSALAAADARLLAAGSSGTGSSEQVATAASDALPEGEAPFAEVVAAAARFVRDTVGAIAGPHVAGDRPRPAAGTLASRSGTAAEQVAVLQALLATRGLTVHPVAVSSVESPGHAAGAVTADAFDRVVAGVVVPEGEEVPAWMLPAGFAVPGGDRLILFDPASRDVSPGRLPDEIAGRPALVLSGAARGVVTLPGLKAEHHRLARTIAVAIAEDGALKVRVESRLTGEIARTARAQFRTSERDYRARSFSAMSARWREATVTRHDVDLETGDGTFVETLELDVPAGPLRVPMFPAAAELLPDVPLARRELAIDFGYPRQVHIETVVTGVPGSVISPGGLTRKGRGWNLESTFRREGGTQTGRWTFELRHHRFEPDAFAGSLRRLQSVLAQSSSATLSLD